MSARRAVISLLLAAPLVACAPPAADDPPDPVLLRIVCRIQRWLEQHEFRVREEDVGRCSGAARQIETTRERMREALEETIEPEPERRRDGLTNRTERVAP